MLEAITTVDPNSRFTYADGELTITGVTRDEVAYIAADYGADYFGGEDFTHAMWTRCSSMSNNAIVGVWGLGNALGEIVQEDDYLGLLWYDDAAQLILREDSPSNQVLIDLSPGTDYYVKLIYTAAAGTLKIEVYEEDVRKLAAEATLTLNATPSKRYLYRAWSQDTDSGSAAGSAVVTDFSLAPTEPSRRTGSLLSPPAPDLVDHAGLRVVEKLGALTTGTDSTNGYPEILTRERNPEVFANLTTGDAADIWAIQISTEDHGAVEAGDVYAHYFYGTPRETTAVKSQDEAATDGDLDDWGTPGVDFPAGNPIATVGADSGTWQFGQAEEISWVDTLDGVHYWLISGILDGGAGQALFWLKSEPESNGWPFTFENNPGEGEALAARWVGTDYPGTNGYSALGNCIRKADAPDLVPEGKDYAVFTIAANSSNANGGRIQVYASRQDVVEGRRLWDDDRSLYRQGLHGMAALGVPAATAVSPLLPHSDVIADGNGCLHTIAYLGTPTAGGQPSSGDAYALMFDPTGSHLLTCPRLLLPRGAEGASDDAGPQAPYRLREIDGSLYLFYRGVHADDDANSTNIAEVSFDSNGVDWKGRNHYQGRVIRDHTYDFRGLSALPAGIDVGKEHSGVSYRLTEEGLLFNSTLILSGTRVWVGPAFVPSDYDICDFWVEGVKQEQVDGVTPRNNLTFSPENAGGLSPANPRVEIGSSRSNDPEGAIDYYSTDSGGSIIEQVTSAAGEGMMTDLGMINDKWSQAFGIRWYVRENAIAFLAHDGNEVFKQAMTEPLPADTLMRASYRYDASNTLWHTLGAAVVRLRRGSRTTSIGRLGPGLYGQGPGLGIL